MKTRTTVIVSLIGIGGAGLAVLIGVVLFAWAGLSYNKATLVPIAPTGDKVGGPALDGFDGTIIVVDSDARITVDGKPVAFDDLESILRGTSAPEKRRVVVKGTEGASYADVIRIVDLVRKVGIEKVSIFTAVRSPS